MEKTVTIVLIAVVLYLALGLVFAIAFITRGIAKVDEGTRGATFGFRIIILPGVVILWPILLRKWIKIRKAKKS